MSLAESVTSALREASLDPLYVEDLVRATLEEDLAGGEDVTSEATIPADQRALATLATRAEGVIAGLPVIEAVFSATSDDVELERRVAEGSWVEPGTPVLTVRGRTRDILVAERTALNLGSRMSGIATATSQWVYELRGTRTAVRDTRKTTPLLRPLEKYAVRVGGGENHRASLSDAALIKDNHVVAAGGITAALRAGKQAAPGLEVEVEVDDVQGALEAVEAGAELILLDNFSVDEVREAVSAVGGRARLEVSGGLTLDAARAYADTGVDFLSVGALTHSAVALDLGLDVEQVQSVAGDDGWPTGRADLNVVRGQRYADTAENPVFG
jgi:nicotinate-nucleotide pyrophosphorylase (carboxylating)